MFTSQNRNRFYQIAGIAGFLAVVGAAACFYILFLGHEQDSLAEPKQAIAERDFKRAQAYLDDYLKREPDDPEALLLAARAARRDHNLSQASSYLQKYKQAGGSAETAALEERLARVQGGEHGVADAVLALPDDAPDIFYVLEAVVEDSVLTLAALERRGVKTGPDFIRARRAADRLLTLPLGPADLAQGLYWSGSIYFYSYDYPRAVADFRRGVELSPTNFEMRKALAELIAQEAPLESLAHLEILARTRPGDPVIMFRIATLQRGVGNTDEARRILDDLLSMRPGEVDWLLERGLLELDCGRVDRAVTFLRRALALAPRMARVHLALSRCMRLQGQAAEADRSFSTFRELEAEDLRADELKGPKK